MLVEDVELNAGNGVAVEVTLEPVTGGTVMVRKDEVAESVEFVVRVA